MKNLSQSNLIAPLAAAAMLLALSAETLAQSSGPSTPTAAGQNPLIGFLLAVALGILVIVVSIIPSKRQSEDV